MISSIRTAIQNSRERAAAKRAYRILEGQSDHILRDIGLTRAGVFSAVVLGRDPR